MRNKLVALIIWKRSSKEMKSYIKKTPERRHFKSSKEESKNGSYRKSSDPDLNIWKLMLATFFLFVKQK